MFLLSLGKRYGLAENGGTENKQDRYKVPKFFYKKKMTELKQFTIKIFQKIKQERLLK